MEADGFELVWIRGELQEMTGLPAGMPLLHWPDGGLFEEVLAYFRHLPPGKRGKGPCVGTMRSMAYAIREWMGFCHAAGRRWDAPEDAWLAEWRDAMLAAPSGSAPSGNTVERKLRFAFDFYMKLPGASPFDRAGRPRAAMVAPAGHSGPVAGMLTRNPVSGVPAWSGSGTIEVGHRVRPIPSAKQVGEIMTRLRTTVQTRRKGSGAQAASVSLAERDWLVGRAMEDAGLRADEAASVTLDNVLETLGRAGIEMPAHIPGPVHPLDALGDTEPGRRALMAQVDAFEGSFNERVSLRVIGKGSKERLIGIPIDLLRDILEVGVFSVRRHRLEAWRAGGGTGPASPFLFLSEKTGRGLKPGTISDIMAASFNKGPPIAGSGHRVRAHFATKSAFRIFSECIALTGGIITDGTMGMAFRKLADLLGHSHSSTTIRYYLDFAVLRHAQVKRPGLDAALQPLWDAIARDRGQLSPARIRLVAGLVSALASSTDDSQLCGLLEVAITRGDLRGPRTIP